MDWLSRYYGLSTMAFPKFAQLPTELQIHIWETFFTTPAMHIFDMCYPTRNGNARIEKALGNDETMTKYKTKVFLDRLNETDPSMYHFISSLRLVSEVATKVAQTILSRQGETTVYFPSQTQTLSIPASDVLFLRFRPRLQNHSELAAEILYYPSPIKEVLESDWSPEVAKTLYSAQRIALDVTETWSAGLSMEFGSDEVAYFACTVQKGLEVLYLVDDCTGRCDYCGRKGLNADNLCTRGSLWSKLQLGNEDREADVIQAVGRRYVEVYDLEKLGWDEQHPSYLFAWMMLTAIQSQQYGADKGKFQGVRVLVVQEDQA